MIKARPNIDCHPELIENDTQVFQVEVSAIHSGILEHLFDSGIGINRLKSDGSENKREHIIAKALQIGLNDLLSEVCF